MITHAIIFGDHHHNSYRELHPIGLILFRAVCAFLRQNCDPSPEKLDLPGRRKTNAEESGFEACEGHKYWMMGGDNNAIIIACYRAKSKES